MGGAQRSVHVYGSGGLRAGQGPDEAAEVCRAYIDRGVKMLIARVVAAVQARAFVAVDANEKCTLATAAWLRGVAADHHLLFIEEPLPALDLHGYRALAQGEGCSIAAGEHLQGLEQAASFPSQLEGTLGLPQVPGHGLAWADGARSAFKVPVEG